MRGTAFPHARVLLVHQPGPWGPRGLLESRCDPDVARRIDLAAANAGMLYTAKGMGALLVPYAAAIAGTMGWHTVFLIAMGFNLLAAALGLLVLKPMRVRHFAATRAEVANQAPAGGRSPMQHAPGN